MAFQALSTVEEKQGREEASTVLILLRADLLTQWFSKLSKHQNNLEGLLKAKVLGPQAHSFSFLDLRWDPLIRYQVCRLC